MARAIWSGSISFGMVTIPVKLYGATESKDISFHLLHATCGTRLKQMRWCPTDEEEVPWSEIVRGLRVRQGPVRHAHRRGLRAASAAEQAHDRAQRLRRGRRRSIRCSTRRATTSRPRTGARRRTRCCCARWRRRISPRSRRSRSGRRNSSARSARTTGALMLETLYYPDEIRKQPEAEPRQDQGDRARARHGLHPDRAAAEAVRARGVQGSLPRGTEPAHRGQAGGPGGRHVAGGAGDQASSTWRTRCAEASRRRRRASPRPRLAAKTRPAARRATRRKVS